MTWMDAVLVAIFFAISLAALRFLHFGWWLAIPLAGIFAGIAWSVGRMGAPR